MAHEVYCPRGAGAQSVSAFSGAAGLEACEVPMVDGHMALEAALPTATAQWGSSKAGKYFMHPGIPNLF